MNILEIKKEDCCGCTACMTICPKNAIKMEFDEQGFKYPKLNKDLCIDCSLCISVCKKKYKNTDKLNNTKAYAVKHKNNKILKKSSSGGVSSALINYFINSGGVVYGVVYDEQFNVITYRSDSIDDIDKYFGSKYVQTDLKLTFNEVLNDLKKNKKVLFIGTSCHINGLKSMLSEKNIDTNYLLTVDFICHGVPSPVLFKDYIKYISKYNKIKSYNFRTKEKPWGFGSSNFGTKIEYIDGKVEVDTFKSRLFLELFFSNNCLRPICYKCKYSSENKPSDITIADYWGLKEVHPEFFTTKGVSAVMIRTKKGEQIFNKLDNIEYIESSIENIKSKQKNMHTPSNKSIEYDDFWKNYLKNGFIYIVKDYKKRQIINNIKNNIKIILKKFVK